MQRHPIQTPDYPGDQGGTLEIDVAHLALLRGGKDVQIVDVREPEEWETGHIPGALHLPLGDLPRRVGALDPERPVVTVCHLGARSLVAATALSEAGFHDARSLAGGMDAWQAAGQPIEQ